MYWKDAFEEGKEMVLSTSSENSPHSNVVLSLGFIEENLLIADTFMNTTIKNIEKNKKVALISKEKGKYYRIKGKAKIYNSGEYFDLCVSKAKEYEVKNAILISIDEIYDLDTGDIIKQG